MSLPDPEVITDLWDAFDDAGFRYKGNNGEVQIIENVRPKREAQLSKRREILRAFLNGKIDLASFKSKMASEAGSNKLWGYAGHSGAKWFNAVMDEHDPETGPDMTATLREVLVAPEDEESAEAQLSTLIDVVRRIRSAVAEPSGSSGVGHAPYFVSYFWQLQDPDTYPIYYSTARQALEELGFWDPTGSHPADYVAFWELNEDIREILEAHTGDAIHLWDIERLCLFSLDREAAGNTLPPFEQPSDASVWQIAPDSSDSLWRAWVENEVASIGWSSVGDFSELSKEQIADELDVSTRSNNVTTIHYFANEISEGDIVLARKGTTQLYGLGIVRSVYEHDPERAADLFPEEYQSHHNLIGVRWVLDFTEEIGKPFDKPNGARNFARPSVRGYSHYGDLREWIVDAYATLTDSVLEVEEQSTALSQGVDPDADPAPPVSVPVSQSLSASLSPEIIHGLHFPDTMDTSLTQLLAEVQAALNAGNHIMFTGPPGTGKTELAEQVADYLAREHEDLYTGAHLTTATADWSTFETVGGYMPSREGDGKLGFRPGQLLRRFKQDDQQRNDITVIDEINRADIDKAFGQLFTVLSGQQVNLPYEDDSGREIVIRKPTAADSEEELSEEEFVVPNSWRLMATMNSYDKTSLYDMSFAFMRRFTFIRVGAPDVPDPDGERIETFIEGYLDEWDHIELEAADPVLRGVFDIWHTINSEDAARRLGPAIVMDMLAFVQGLDYSTKVKRNQAVTKAVAAYVFPQLEGMLEKHRSGLLDDIGNSPHVDEKQLERIAAEQFY